jgi:RHS repeat-associated protein
VASGGVTESYSYDADGERYYDPVLGRFISPDTLVPDPTDPQDLNRSTYAKNNPMRYTDPTGHRACGQGACLEGGGQLGGTGGPGASGAVGSAGQAALDVGVVIVYVTQAGVRVTDAVGEFVTAITSGAGAAAPAGSVGGVGEGAGAGADAGEGEPDASVQPKGGTYVLKDPETGAVERTGRTKDLERRRGEHARDPEFSDLDFDVDARTDDYAQQRGREQILHEKYNPPKNIIRPIRPDHPQRKHYLDEGGKVQGNY